MRRSEMLEILRKSVLKHMNHMECCTTDDEMYSHILQDLEANGMRAPIFTVKDNELELGLRLYNHWETE